MSASRCTISGGFTHEAEAGRVTLRTAPDADVAGVASAEAAASGARMSASVISCGRGKSSPVLKSAAIAARRRAAGGRHTPAGGPARNLRLSP